MHRTPEKKLWIKTNSPSNLQDEIEDESQIQVSSDSRKLHLSQTKPKNYTKELLAAPTKLARDMRR